MGTQCSIICQTKGWNNFPWFSDLSFRPSARAKERNAKEDKATF